MNENKIIKTAKGLDTFAKFVGVILIAGMVLLVVGSILVFITMNSQMKPSFVNFSQTVSVGNLSIAVKDLVVQDYKALCRWFLATAAAAMVTMAVFIAGIRTVRRILKPMKEGRPFDTDIPANLKKLGWLVIAGGILSVALESFRNTGQESTNQTLERWPLRGAFKIFCLGKPVATLYYNNLHVI